ncbi:hypothetical protein H0H81_006058 [Sphagnurus paluster]|uniref:Tim44-like domain-containing protein n=1 Tax=Sphagnurus paluster TaxID=117069 RepID=A0A9P7FVF8_9AGAR|nr:hypothetical protein H0H81_006058 [Sphagnurus paluster]
MALSISRRYVGNLGLQAGPLALVGRSRSGNSNLHFAVRGYAASAVKQKQKPKNPTVAANTGIKASGSKGPRNAPAKSTGPPDATTSASQTSTTAARDLRKTAAGGVSYKIPEKKEEALTEEEQMAQVEQIMNMSTLFPTADPWGQRVETLDVTIPYSTKLSHRKDYADWRSWFDQWVANRYSGAKNYVSMMMLAQQNAIPGIDLSEATRLQKYITQWPWRLATTTSIAPGSWMEPLRKAALQSYTQLSLALARQDDKAIKELSTSVYQDHVLRTRRKQSPNFTYLWRLHKEVTPARVISIRATEGYLATEDPKFGNRMMVHALVRLDTEQSLEIYDRLGNPVHARASNAAELGSSSKHPAERRRVQEYLIFEKRMWYDGPWVIREQLWELPGKSAAV